MSFNDWPDKVYLLWEKSSVRRAAERAYTTPYPRDARVAHVFVDVSKANEWIENNSDPAEHDVIPKPLKKGELREYLCSKYPTIALISENGDDPEDVGQFFRCE